MASEFDESVLSKYNIDPVVVAKFLSIMSDESNILNEHEIGVESADLHFDIRKAIAGSPRTEKFLKDYSLNEGTLFDLIELCTNLEFLDIRKKNIMQGEDYGRDHIYFFTVQDAGKAFIANHKK